MPVDKLGADLKEGDIVAFVYYGGGADLKIGKILNIKQKTRRRIKDTWLYIKIVSVSEKEYEDLQWVQPKNSLKLANEMLNDVLLAKLSQVTPGSGENIDLLSSEKVNEIKEAFLARGAIKVNLRNKDHKQFLRVEFHRGGDFVSDIYHSRQAFAKKLADAVAKECGVPNFQVSGWNYVFTVRLNP